jgi:hypothetical protein
MSYNVYLLQLKIKILSLEIKLCEMVQGGSGQAVDVAQVERSLVLFALSPNCCSDFPFAIHCIFYQSIVWFTGLGLSN